MLTVASQNHINSGTQLVATIEQEAIQVDALVEIVDELRWPEIPVS